MQKLGGKCSLFCAQAAQRFGHRARSVPAAYLYKASLRACYGPTLKKTGGADSLTRAFPPPASMPRRHVCPYLDTTRNVPGPTWRITGFPWPPSSSEEEGGLRPRFPLPGGKGLGLGHFRSFRTFFAFLSAFFSFFEFFSLPRFFSFFDPRSSRSLRSVNFSSLRLRRASGLAASASCFRSGICGSSHSQSQRRFLVCSAQRPASRQEMPPRR